MIDVIPGSAIIQIEETLLGELGPTGPIGNTRSNGFQLVLQEQME